MAALTAYTYGASGGALSSAARGAEFKRFNIEQKARRWAEALAADGMTPADLTGLAGALDPDEAAAARAEWKAILAGLQAKGLLPAKEKVPGDSAALIITYLGEL